MKMWNARSADIINNNTHIVICRDPLPDLGGIENMGYWLTRVLAQNVDHVILVGRKKSLNKDILPEYNIYQYGLKNTFSLRKIDIPYLIIKLLYLRFFIGKKVYVYSLFLRNMRALKWIKKITQWKYITYIHGNEILKKDDKHIVKINKWLNKNDSIIGVSHYTISLISDENIKKNSFVNHPGISPDFVKRLNSHTIPAEYKLSGHPKILMLSRLVERKGHKLCIEAVSELVAKYPNIRLYIGGLGPEKEIIENHVKHFNIQDNVIFLGYIPEKDKPLLFKQVDVYCMPSALDMSKSEVEGFGITFLEAAAARVIPIGSNTGGIVDAIEHDKSGYLVHPADRKQLVNTLDKIFSRPKDHVPMRDYAQRRAIKNFTWMNHVEKLLANLP